MLRFYYNNLPVLMARLIYVNISYIEFTYLFAECLIYVINTKMK